MPADPAASLEGIAIVGLAGRFPGAESVSEFWNVLVEGRETLSTFDRAAIPAEEPARDADYVPRRGVIDRPEWFDAAFFNIAPREAEAMDPQQRVFLEACWHALENAGCDPQQFPGSIGVFAGMSNNSWLQHRVLANEELRGQVGYENAMICNEKDYLATRTAYKLDLRGPALNIYTACSTSLVAVCQAVQALQSFQCDAALAGGVSVKWPQERGYTAQEGSIYSPDGHCRPYDAAATGTVFSNGLGVVFLKRLEDAVRDKDHIWAVIKGAALNNDGADKVSFTAPSPDGHAEVIALAHALAGFEPDTVGYIEGHGTATPIGDPIEVAGLTKAFRQGTDRTGYCGLGSLKSNMGHMDAASGVAGLIKATLALHHRQLPPTLHFKSPNPALQLADSPFFIVDRLQAWESGDTPRRAGVSSFGVGGTNAHVALEESPVLEAAEPDTRPQLLTVSAKSAAALETACAQLAAWLEQNPAPLDRVAWTLQTGRGSFPHRCAVAASTAEEAIRLLRENTVAATVAKAGGFDQLILLFPGQGAQHLRMGAAVYDAEPVFRETFDRCADLFAPLLDFDLRTLLHPAAGEVESLRAALQETRLTQPALFTVEYALATLLTSWGLTPSGMLGHSIGEYVAATLAGVWPLEDAATLVAARGRIMQAQAPGAMLAVRLPETEVAAKLPDNLDIATVNSPATTVVAGTAEDIRAFAAALAAEGIGASVLHTSHAFHSRMMDSALEAFRAVWDTITLSEPRSLWTSNVTGRAITAAEAVSPDYWLRHLRTPVRFADGIASLAAEPRAFIECGPGTTLTSMARQHPAAKNSVFISLFPRSSSEGEGEYTALLNGLGKLWAAGVSIDWTRLHAVTPQRTPLPGYPFERRRFCPDAPLPAGTRRDGEGWLHYPLNGAAPVAPNAPSANGSAAPVEPGTTPAAAPEIAEAPAPAPAAPVDRATHLVQEIRSLLHRTSGIDITTADPAASFLDLGFDSLFLTQASLALKKHFGVKITFRQLMEQQSSMQLLAAWLDEKLAPGSFLPAAPAPVATASPAAALASTAVVPGGPIEDRLSRIELALAKLAGLPVHEPASHGGDSGASVFKVKVREQTGSEGKRIAFGPFRPLEKRVEGGLTARQDAHLRQLITDYVARYPRTRQFTADHRPVFADPRAVGGFNPLWKDMVFPAVTDRSEGPYLWDIDGHRWVDVVHGFGSGFFGHKPAFVVEAVKAQLDRGYEIGPTCPIAGEVARLVCEFSGKERVAFCNTGSEALMAAIRVSRTITGRDRIAMFAGGYHGIFDEVLARPLVSNGELRTIPIAPGIPESAQANIIVLEYGHPESLEIIKRHAHEIAAVLVEPVPSRRPDIAPVEFVQELRRITAEAGTALVFDEVVLGFRTHPQGAQHLFGISADLVSYGKVIGGGMPLGVLAGTSRFMDALDGGQWEYGDDSAPEVGMTFFAGTFIRHPLTMAAARAVLQKLKHDGPALQADNDAKAAAFVDKLNALFTESAVPVHVTRYSSLWMLHADSALKHFSLLFYHLRLRGIHIWEGRGNFVSLAHTEADLDIVLEAFRDSVRALQAGGFLPGGEAAPLTVPSTPAQREMFLQSQLSTEASLACHESLTLNLSGPVDAEKVQRTLTSIAALHDSLRAVFSADGQSMTVAPKAAWPLRVVQTTEDKIESLKEEDFLAPFDTASGPLVRATLAQLPGVQARLILTAHHIVCDGWSFGVVVHDFCFLYAGDTKPPAPAAYADYSLAEATRRSGAEHAEQRVWWSRKLAAVPAPVALPADRPRAGTPQYASAMTHLDVSADLTARVQRFCATRRMTPYHVALAAFRILVYRLSGQSDFLVGTPSAAQISRDLPDLVGHCVQFLPLRFTHAPEDTGEAVLTSTRQEVLDSSENDGVTFGEILESLPGLSAAARRGLLPLSFSFESMPEAVAFSGLTGSVEMNAKRRLSFEASFYVQNGADAIRLVCAWQTALYDQATIQRWLGHYLTVLDSLISAPETTISRLPVITPDERSFLLSAFASTAPTLTDDRSLHSWFEDIAAQYPDRIAIGGGGGRTFTYHELNARANRLARRLREAGVQRESLTGLCLERTPEMVVAVLAILKAGGAYLPIDLSYPADRLAFMLADAEAPVLLTQRSLLPRLPQHRARLVLVDELDDGSLSSLEETNVESVTAPDDAAYVIYTSGSTGKPKGCIVTHRNVTRLMRSTEHWYHFNEKDVWTLFHSIAFDFSVWELWGALLYGGRLVVVPFDVSRSPEEFRKLLGRENVTVLNQTPGAFRQLMRADEQADSSLSLRWVIFGGEALEMESLRPWFARHGDTKPQLVNMYGITETTVHVTYRTLSQHDLAGGSVIGEPIPDLQVYVLEPATLEPQPQGVCGEMYVGGAGLARGYLNRRDLTAERFVPNHLTGEGRLYKTGDLARIITGADGRPDLEYLGRIDHQVKVRGFRIELGEIESVLNTHPAVRESAVFPLRDAAGENRLVAWLVAKGDAPAHSELRSHLLTKLPDYMVPASFILMERFPLTNNGKLDRAALPAPDTATVAADTDAFVAPQTGTEIRLAGIWEQVLGRNHIGRESEFFAIGGTSLNALRVMERVHQEFSVKLPLGVLFDAPSLGDFAARIDYAGVEPRKFSPVTCIQAEGSGPPLFLLHGGDGGALFYRSLLGRMGRDHPVWVIESPGLIDDNWLLARHSIESCAAEYLKLIRGVYPSGPIIVGGYSYGGVVAYEMCHLLRNEGREPETLILFDTENPADGPRELSITERFAAGWRQGGKGFASKLRHLGERIGSGLRNRAKHDATTTAVRTLIDEGRVASNSTLRTAQIHVNHLDALNVWEPAPYDGPVLLFRSDALSDKYARTEDYNWRTSAPDLRIVRVPGDHLVLFEEPWVSTLAEKLKEELTTLRSGLLLT